MFGRTTGGLLRDAMFVGVAFGSLLGSHAPVFAIVKLILLAVVPLRACCDGCIRFLPGLLHGHVPFCVRLCVCTGDGPRAAGRVLGADRVGASYVAGGDGPDRVYRTWRLDRELLTLARSARMVILLQGVHPDALWSTLRRLGRSRPCWRLSTLSAACQRSRPLNLALVAPPFAPLSACVLVGLRKMRLHSDSGSHARATPRVMR